MKKYIIPTLIIIIIYACATVQSPVGGEKDTISPELVSSTPKHQSLNFKGKEITLLFSEWMKVENLQKELIITPRSKIEYTHLLKKELLTITLEEPLADSTTYTLNFRQSLKDITEGNLWENPVLAFSTGSYLDSMEVKGKVMMILTKEPAKSFTVALYDANYDTANLRQGEPVYFTTTNDLGEYKLQNLKPGKYLLYGFQDANNNLKNEPASEAYSFHPTSLDLFDSIPDINMEAYKSNEDTLKLKKSSPTGSDFVINYNKGLINYRITDINNPGSYVFANDEEQAKNIRIYLSNFRNIDFDTDSLPVQVEAFDSIGNERTDTIFVKFRESRIKSEDLKILQMPKKDILPGNQEFTISLNKPAYAINTDSIYIKYDSVLIKNITLADITLSNNKKKVNINTEIFKQKIDSIDNRRKQITDSIAALPKDTTNKKETKASSSEEGGEESKNIMAKGKSADKPGTEGKKIIRGLHLYVGKASFIGVEGDSSASNNVVFQFKKEENYGTIEGKIIGGDSTDYIIELLDNKYNVVDTLYNKDEYTFNYVKPGDYYLRVIIDANGNKKWDPGNALTLKPHEEIIYLKEQFPVRTNWIVSDKNIVLTRDESVDKE